MRHVHCPSPRRGVHIRFNAATRITTQTIRRLNGDPAMPKLLSFDAQARQSLLQGVEKLASAVKSTLGPRGRTAVLDKGWGSPNVTKDGVTVAEEIELRDKNEKMG